MTATDALIAARAMIEARAFRRITTALVVACADGDEHMLDGGAHDEALLSLTILAPGHDLDAFNDTATHAELLALLDRAIARGMAA